MYLRSAVAALAGMSALAAAAPTPTRHEHDVMPLEKGLKHKTRAQKRAPLIIQQNIIEPTVVVVEQNLDTISQLALLAEQQFAALIHSQLSLLQTVEDIKDNIRINHFRSRFTTVNTVIVSVTQIVDVRDENNYNNRYLVNQLLADNGFPESEVIVMLTAAEAMTIGLPTPSVDAAGLFGDASAVSSPTGVPSIGNFDPNSPFGAFNSSLILPYGSAAPTMPEGAQIFADPASIILAGQQNLFIEDISLFSQDCLFWGANGNSLFNLAAQVLIAEQIAAAQLAGLQIGANLDQAVALALLQGATETATADYAKETEYKDEKKEDDKEGDDKKSM